MTAGEREVNIYSLDSKKRFLNKAAPIKHTGILGGQSLRVSSLTCLVQTSDRQLQQRPISDIPVEHLLDAHRQTCGYHGSMSAVSVVWFSQVHRP